MSDTSQNGKGSRARNVGPRFKQRFDEIDWRPSYRLVFDDEGKLYIIRADECQVFCHWLAARKGQRHFPQDFSPFLLDKIEQLRFKEWSIESRP